MSKLAQRYARATISSNLKNDQWHFDTDSLAAVALSSEFGSMLFRVKFANDSTSYVRLAEEWEWEVKKRAAVDGWPVHIKDAVVAKAALKYWLNDLCPLCNGKCLKKHEFVDTLSDEPCDLCEGTGKRPLEADRHNYRYVNEMVGLLDSVAIRAGAVAMKKLARDMDL